MSSPSKATGFITVYQGNPPKAEASFRGGLTAYTRIGQLILEATIALNLKLVEFAIQEAEIRKADAEKRKEEARLAEEEASGPEGSDERKAFIEARDAREAAEEERVAAEEKAKEEAAAAAKEEEEKKAEAEGKTRSAEIVDEAEPEIEAVPCVGTDYVPFEETVQGKEAALKAGEADLPDNTLPPEGEGTPEGGARSADGDSEVESLDTTNARLREIAEAEGIEVGASDNKETLQAKIRDGRLEGNKERLLEIAAEEGVEGVSSHDTKDVIKQKITDHRAGVGAGA